MRWNLFTLKTVLSHMKNVWINNLWLSVPEEEVSALSGICPPRISGHMWCPSSPNSNQSLERI